MKTHRPGWGLFPPEMEARGAGQPPRRVQAITCGACGGRDALTAWPSVLPDDALIPKFRKRGWQVGVAGRHRCPDCRRRAAGPRLSPPPTESPLMTKAPRSSPAAPALATSSAALAAAGATSAPPVVTDGGPPVVSLAASRAIVAAYVVLEDAYDRERRAYRDGWSDARVAAETGLSPVDVAKRRERDFGPLVVDKGADIRAAVKALDLVLREAASQADALTATLGRATAACCTLSDLLEAR